MNIKNMTIVVAVTGALALAAITAASAKGGPPTTEKFMAGLEGAGYTVTISPSPAKHATLNATGTVITIDKGGKGAALEIIDYDGSRDALKTDWTADDGSGPRPRVATSDFAGRVLYWNEDSVLAVDFRDPNFREAAQAAGEISLGRRGTGGPTTAPAGGTAGTKLPATGGGPGVAHAGLGDLLLPLALLIAGSVLVATCLGAARQRRN